MNLLKTFDWIVEKIKLCFQKSRRKRRLFLISDTHYGHRNVVKFIGKYGSRSFENERIMGRQIQKNWNGVVKKSDVVFFLGDFVFRGSIGHWITRLHGKKKLIRGNHDYKLKYTVHHVKFRYKGYNFYLVHNPQHVPKNWNGWIIHGHVHGHTPFIDGVRKRINVSCEVVNHTPVNIDWIISLNIDTIKQMNTVKSKPVLWI